MPQPRRRQSPPPGGGPQMLTARIDLMGAHPPIWRRMELRSDLTLHQVNAVIQAVFNWENSHMHEFSSLSADGPVPEQRFEPAIQQEMSKNMDLGPDLGFGERMESGNEEETTVGSLLKKHGDKLFYTYDFGDSWEHQISVEKVVVADADAPPARCIGGAKAGPPDDCGGIWQYQLLADLYKHPNHPEYNDYQDQIEWVFGEEGELDPDTFDLDRAQRRLDLAISSGYTWWFEDDEE